MLLLGFDSIHDVLRAEKLLRGADIPFDLVPTPRDLSADCGMSIECPPEQRERILALDARAALRVRKYLLR